MCFETLNQDEQGVAKYKLDTKTQDFSVSKRFFKFDKNEHLSGLLRRWKFGAF